MRFRDFKRFGGKTLEDITSWINDELNSVMREVFIGLNRLRFQENFDSFEVEVTLLPTEERQISHPFREMPTGYIIYKQVGNGVIDAGVTPWTNQVVYLRNNSASENVTVKAIFFA